MQDAASKTPTIDDLPSDPAALRAIVIAQRQALAERDAALAQRDAALAEQLALVAAQFNAIAAIEEERDRWRSDCEAFKAWIERLNRARFGRSSEQRDPRQLLLEFPDDPAAALAMAEALDEAAAAAQEELDAREPSPRRPRRARRKLSENGDVFPEYLPRVVETIEPQKGEMTCATHGPKKPFEFDETKTLEFIPPKLFVRVRRYPKYVCEKHAECGVTQAPRAPAIVAGNRYDVSVAIQIWLAKYAYYLPLYRQQDLLAACGWTPSRSTLNNLLAKIDELFLPVIVQLRLETLAGGAVGCDDTTITLVTPPFAPPIVEGDPRSRRVHEAIADAIEAQKPSLTARMWAYYSHTAPLNFFDFTTSRHRDGPAEVLADFRGTLMADCYAGFEAIVMSSDLRIARAACWAHARRKFEALETKYPVHAARMLALCSMLYDVEARAKGMAVDERRALREAESRPILDRIREFLWGPIYDETTPKSELRAAMNYARNHWKELQVFVTDGRLPIDNNDTEQLMKQVATGRKNWLFIGSVKAGERASRLMSLVSSALRNDLDVEKYLTDVARQLLEGCTDYRRLLPDAWRADHPEAIRTYRVEERRDAGERKAKRREKRRLHKQVTDQFTDEEKAELIRKAKRKLLRENAKRAAGENA